MTARRAPADIFGANSTNGDWSTPSTWLDSAGATGVPSLGDEVFIGTPRKPVPTITGSNAHVTLADAVSVASVTIGSSGTTTGSGTLTIGSGGSLSATTLTLDAGTTGAARLVLDGGTLSVDTLQVLGAGAAVTRQAGEAISAATLVVGGGSTLETAPADSFSTSVSVRSGGTLVLGDSLALTGNASIDAATLDLNGSNIVVTGSLVLANSATLARGATQGVIQAAGFAISGSSSLTLIAGDVLTGDGRVFSGGGLDINVSLDNIASLGISGVGSSVTVNQSLTGASGATLSVDAGATLTVNAGVTVESLRVTAATLELANGVINATDVVLGGSAGPAIVLRSEGGGTLSLGNVAVTNASSLQALPGDQFGSLDVSGASVVQVTQATGATTGLWITTDSDEALSITGVSSTLMLVFDGLTAGTSLDWILKWNGDHRSVLESLISSSAIVIDNQGSGTLEVRYDSTVAATFVMMVPEPGGVWIAVSGIGLLVGFARSRRRGVPG